MRCPLCKATLPRLMPQAPWPTRQRARLIIRQHQAGACLPHPDSQDPWADLYETTERVSTTA